MQILNNSYSIKVINERERSLILLAFAVVLGFGFSCIEKPRKAKTSITEQYKPEKIMKVTTITFPSSDGLTVTADAYLVDEKPITMVLCHQAGYSRGEYKDTALKLNEIGYSVLAIDQRSGGEVNGMINLTAAAARKKGLSTAYFDAKPDIEAAVDYVFENNSHIPVILVGSSYSSVLALLIGKGNDKVAAIASFSPGEYYKDLKIQDEIADIAKPVYVTSSQSEAGGVAILTSKMHPSHVTHYVPTAKGIHGSRVLWEGTAGSADYWDSFTSFLRNLQ